MTEKRIINMNDLRNLCIKHDWYTKGNNEEYGKMLEMADKLENVETENIVEIANNILMHSETDYELSSICFEIAKICNSFFN